MSRRRRPEPAMSLVAPSGDHHRPLFPADMSVSLDLIDPGGHRVIRIVRYLAEVDPHRWIFLKDTIGPNVLFEYEPTQDEAGWERVWFTCKSCRDSGRPMSSTALWQEIVSAGNGYWDEAGDAPRRERFELHVPGTV